MTTELDIAPDYDKMLLTLINNGTMEAETKLKFVKKILMRMVTQQTQEFEKEVSFLLDIMENKDKNNEKLINRNRELLRLVAWYYNTPGFDAQKLRREAAAVLVNS